MRNELFYHDCDCECKQLYLKKKKKKKRDFEKINNC